MVIVYDVFQFLQENKFIIVKIVLGVIIGELSEFFIRNNLCLMFDVILDKVMYGGVIVIGCYVR